MPKKLAFLLITLMVVVLAGCDYTDSYYGAPDPTPNLTNTNEITAYAKQVLSDAGPFDVYAPDTMQVKQTSMDVSYYYPMAVTQDLMFKTLGDCFAAEKALWQSRLGGVLTTITVHVQSDWVFDDNKTVKHYEVGSCSLTSAKAKQIKWDGLDDWPAWEQKVYDSQWLEPSLEQEHVKEEERLNS